MKEYGMNDLNHRMLVAKLRLIRSQNIGPITYYKLIEMFGDAERALDALPELARRGGVKGGIRICSPSKAEQELEHLQRAGGRMICHTDPEYPTLLRHVEDAPPLLSVRGTLPKPETKTIGIVGARNASSNARCFAARIARELGEAEYCVVSGLARGIDTAAHEGSIDTGSVGVLGCGIDIVYPRENAALFDQMIEKGAIISEIPVGRSPQARFFPARNRIIAGMSYGVVVIEAAVRSGTLITARLALEQGREVFAVPGSPQDPRARGSNNLIRQGATVTEEIGDITEIIDLMHPPTAAAKDNTDTQIVESELFHSTPMPLDGTCLSMDELSSKPEDPHKLIESLLNPTPIPIDRIVRDTHLSTTQVTLALLEMEMSGMIERSPGNCVSLAGS